MDNKERKAIIKNSDMTEEMQQDAINVSVKAIDTYSIEKTRKKIIKRYREKINKEQLSKKTFLF